MKSLIVKLRKNYSPFTSNLVLLLVVLLLSIQSSRSFAQQQPKFGYVAADQIILVMPEARKIDSALRQFKVDSIDAILPYVLSEYKRKDSLSKTEKNPVIKKQLERESEQLRFQLENWNQIGQNRLQEKQNELLAPLYKKLADAIDDIAKTEKYTYIFRAETLLHAPESENISEKILKKLGIKIPAEMMQ